MPSDCPACAKAATESHCALFRNGCPGCAARAVSRGKNFFDSRKAGRQTSAYRMELHQFGVSHDQVLEAWKADATNQVGSPDFRVEGRGSRRPTTAGEHLKDEDANPYR